MFPVQVHWVLNHAPLFGLVTGLAFFISDMKQSSDFALLAGARIFAAVGAVSIPIVASSWRYAHALSAAGWLDTRGVVLHQRAGILTLVILIALAVLSGIVLTRSSASGGAGSFRSRTAILVPATLGLGMVVARRQAPA